ncbi:saccharopine dehydrogenase NADP-binding domain-containing protein [Candidatus Fermentibacteria bacterium]|nr:saccharopine dehydrogenase NADP-binding domain-containing protein [Candidatus Fermentibacteria bacterium]
MKIAVLGGAGLMGSGTVRDLVSRESAGIDRVIVADIDLDKARRLVDSLGDKRLEPARLDVRDRRSCLAVLKAVDICINGVPTFAGFQMDIFHCCLEAKCHYIDFGGMGIYTPQQKAEHDAWSRAGVTAILGLGSDPGMSNVLCKAVAEQLEEIDKISLYWASKLVGDENPVLVPPYSISTLLGEYANNSKQFINGELVDKPPLSGEVSLVLPPPFGQTEFVHSQHSEPLTVPFAKGIKDKGIREFTWRLHLPEKEHEVYKSLVKVGFGEFAVPIDFRGMSVAPAEFLEALIARNIERNRHRIPHQDAYEIHLAIGEGRMNRKKTTVQCMVFVAPDPFYTDYNDAATSMNASIGAQLLGRPKPVPGVWGPEEYYNVQEYFSELKKRHFKITLAVTTEEEL